MDYQKANELAAFMLVFSFALLLPIAIWGQKLQTNAK
jgi:ABC-type sulfate transport system permease component